MGIEILSFTIKDVYDDVQYLQSLGKAQTASVKRDADSGVAEANRDAGIREAECERAAMDVKYATDTKIEDNSRMFKLQKANFDQEINTAVSESVLCQSIPINLMLNSFTINRKLSLRLPMNCKRPKFAKKSVMKKSRLMLLSARSKLKLSLKKS